MPAIRAQARIAKLRRRYPRLASRGEQVAMLLLALGNGIHPTRGLVFAQTACMDAAGRCGVLVIDIAHGFITSTLPGGAIVGTSRSDWLRAHRLVDDQRESIRIRCCR
jgi:hypothetical protein